MPRKESEAVPEGNGLIPQPEEYGSGQPTLTGAFRQIKLMMSHFEKQTKMLETRLTYLEHDARQPRLAMEADGPANTKTQERTEGAATAVQVMRGDSCTTEQKVQDRSKTSITIGVEAEPLDLSCREDVLVEDGARAPKSCLPPILGDTLTNSRRWLSSHRRSLHSHGDHLQRATSSVRRDRGDESRGGLEDGKFMDFDSIRLVRQQQLLETVCCSMLPEGR